MLFVIAVAHRRIIKLLYLICYLLLFFNDSLLFRFQNTWTHSPNWLFQNIAIVFILGCTYFILTFVLALLSTCLLQASCTLFLLWFRVLIANGWSACMLLWYSADKTAIRIIHLIHHLNLPQNFIHLFFFRPLARFFLARLFFFLLLFFMFFFFFINFFDLHVCVVFVLLHILDFRTNAWNFFKLMDFIIFCRLRWADDRFQFAHPQISHYVLNFFVELFLLLCVQLRNLRFFRHFLIVSFYYYNGNYFIILD